jgi:uncharacterized protein DUF5715
MRGGEFKSGRLSWRAPALGLLLIIFSTSCSRAPKDTHVPPPPHVSAPMVDPWKEAARKVEEDRGEPIGRKAEVDVPSQLEHYSDRRRFLAVQQAEWREQKYPIPEDYVELIELIRNGQLVEMEPFGPHYILYGVGVNATDEPFTHYDAASGENVPLYSDIKEYQTEHDRLAASIKELQSKLPALQNDLRKIRKRDRARRKALQSQIADVNQSAAGINKRMRLLDSFYKAPEQRSRMLSKYAAVKDFAANFGGQSYDLNDPASRQKLKVRLLSYIRPEARDLLFEIARSYSEKFDRPLPVTSLVRTEQYQKHLSETNPNATRTAVPPHTTGLAFDVFYYYMTSEEQLFLMQEVARLKDEGRLEALREKRNHIHIFAFADGQRPDENLITESMNRMQPAVASKKAAAGKRKGSSKNARLAKSGKKTSKKPGIARTQKRRAKRSRQSGSI